MCTYQEYEEDTHVTAHCRVIEVRYNNGKYGIKDFRSYNFGVTSLCHVNNHNPKETENKAELYKSIVNSKPAIIYLRFAQQEYKL